MKCCVLPAAGAISKDILSSTKGKLYCLARRRRENFQGILSSIKGEMHCLARRRRDFLGQLYSKSYEISIILYNWVQRVTKGPPLLRARFSEKGGALVCRIY